MDLWRLGHAEVVRRSPFRVVLAVTAVTVIILIYKENMGHYNNTTNQINLVPSFLPISPAEGVSVVIQPCI